LHSLKKKVHFIPIFGRFAEWHGSCFYFYKIEQGGTMKPILFVTTAFIIIAALTGCASIDAGQPGTSS
jgi:hypothetical protein